MDVQRYHGLDCGRPAYRDRTAFDIDTILTTANHLKYTRAIQNTLNDWMTNPPEEFFRLVSAEFLVGKHFKAALKDQFTAVTKRAFQQLIGDKINERLKGAMTPEPPLSPVSSVAATPEAEGGSASQDGFTPSAIELEAYQIIRAILRPVVKPSRIFIRDAASYCAILFDDNNRKPICRLRFNNEAKLVVGLFNESKEEERIAISTVDELFDFGKRLTACVNGYLDVSTDKIVDPLPV